MTKEEKQLLIKDLCARLPYGVICDMWFEWNEADKITEVLKCGGLMRLMNSEFNFIVKPYLRPMSSMTDEEDKEWQSYKCSIAESCDGMLEEKINALHDWFNSRHLDWRRLIPKGLALEATEGMYK